MVKVYYKVMCNRECNGPGCTDYVYHTSLMSNITKTVIDCDHFKATLKTDGRAGWFLGVNAYLDLGVKVTCKMCNSDIKTDNNRERFSHVYDAWPARRTNRNVIECQTCHNKVTYVTGESGHWLIGLPLALCTFGLGNVAYCNLSVGQINFSRVRHCERYTEFKDWNVSSISKMRNAISGSPVEQTFLEKNIGLIRTLGISDPYHDFVILKLVNPDTVVVEGEYEDHMYAVIVWDLDQDYGSNIITEIHDSHDDASRGGFRMGVFIVRFFEDIKLPALVNAHPCIEGLTYETVYEGVKERMLGSKYSIRRNPEIVVDEESCAIGNCQSLTSFIMETYTVSEPQPDVDAIEDVDTDIDSIDSEWTAE